MEVSAAELSESESERAAKIKLKAEGKPFSRQVILPPILINLTSNRRKQDVKKEHLSSSGEKSLTFETKEATTYEW